jgi:hypothetical protein
MASVIDAAEDSRRVGKDWPVPRGSNGREETNTDRKRLVLGVGSISLLMILLVPWAFAQAPVREITQIAGEAYRFRNQNRFQEIHARPAWSRAAVCPRGEVRRGDEDVD